MKIVVLGTSNSVIGINGYLKSLSHDHEVINLSCGRVPIFYHIKMVLENIELIETADLLILDHYVNDVNLYSKVHNEEYLIHYNHFFKLIASLNTNVVNVLFPIVEIANNPQHFIYQYVLKACKEHKISVIDLNKLNLIDCLMPGDPLHLNITSSYLFGIYLSNQLNKILLVKKENKLPEIKKGKIEVSDKTFPYKIMDVQKLKLLFPHFKLTSFKNSLIEADFIEATEEFTIHSPSNCSLIAIGYLNPRNLKKISGFELEGKKYGLPGFGYFLESIPMNIQGAFKINPLQGKIKRIPDLVGRNSSSDELNNLNLTDLMFFDKTSMLNATEAQGREILQFDLSNFEDIVEKVYPDEFRLSDKAFYRLRDYGITLTKTDLKLAIEILGVAQKLRPNIKGLRERIRKLKETI